MREALIYVLSAAGMVAASYLLGHLAALAAGEVDEGRFAYAFRRLSLGTLLIVTLYALVNCAGATILAAVPPLLLFGVRFRMPRWRRIEVSPCAALLFLGVFAAVAILKYFGANDLAGNLYTPRFDHSFYAALANYVGQSGIESANFDLMFPALQSPSIYHWFDIHLSALLGQLTGNYYNARLFISLPLLTSLATLSLAALIGKYCTGASGKAIPWLACLVFLIPYDFGAFPFLDSPDKTYVMVCVIAWAILSKDKVLPLVIGGVLVSSAAPALFTGAFIALTVRFWRNRRSGEYWKEVVVLALGGVWCAAFYTLTARANPYFIHYLSIPQQFDQAFSEFSLPMAKGAARSFTVRIALNFAICIVLFALLRKEDKKRIVRSSMGNEALFFAIPAGLAFACAFWYVRDGVQLASEVCMPLAFVGQALLPAILLSGRRRVVAKVATAVIVGASVVAIGLRADPYRGRPLIREFLDKVAAIEGPVVWVDTSERRETGSEYVRDPNYITPFSTVRRLRNDYFPIRLDVYDIVYDPNDIRDYSVLASIENSTFYRWVESRKIPMTELRNAQTRFIKENGIHYVITPSNDQWIYDRGFRIEEKTELESRGYTLFRISYDENTVQ